MGDDGSEEAGRAGELAAGIGKLFDARVLLMRVYPSVPVFRARRVVHVRASEEVLRRGKRDLERRAAELESVSGDTSRDQGLLGRRGGRHPGDGRRERGTDASSSWTPGPGGRTVLHTRRCLRRRAKGR